MEHDGITQKKIHTLADLAWPPIARVAQKHIGTCHEPRDGLGKHQKLGLKNDGFFRKSPASCSPLL
jgi:hypothetical protein